jgi:hypothetical protein
MKTKIFLQKELASQISDLPASKPESRAPERVGNRSLQPYPQANTSFKISNLRFFTRLGT